MDELRKAVMAHRYEKMAEALSDRVRDAARDKVSCEDVSERDAINESCEDILREAENTFGTNEFYWVLELIMNDEFGCDLSPLNPYQNTIKQKTKYTAEMSVMGIPVIKMEG